MSSTNLERSGGRQAPRSVTRAELLGSRPVASRVERITDRGGKVLVRRVYRFEVLRRVFPNAVLARYGSGKSLEYRLFVKEKPSADVAIFWSAWAAGALLEHGGGLGRLSFGWGVLTAAGWEHIG